MDTGTIQHDFLMTALRQVDRQTPWLVVATHRPLFVDSAAGWDAPAGHHYHALRMKLHVANQLYASGVDVIWGAHHHSYQRSCALRPDPPQFNGSCANGPEHGMVVVNIGMAGAGDSGATVSHPRGDIWEYVDNS